MDSVYSAGRDLFLMARQVASCPLDVPPPSELCCSCERCRLPWVWVEASLLLTPSSFLAVDSCLLGPSLLLFLFPHLLVGQLIVLSLRVAGMTATSRGTRLLCRLVTGLGMGQVFSEDAYPVR